MRNGACLDASNDFLPFSADTLSFVSYNLPTRTIDNYTDYDEAYEPWVVSSLSVLPLPASSQPSQQKSKLKKKLRAKTMSSKKAGKQKAKSTSGSDGEDSESASSGSKDASGVDDDEEQAVQPVLRAVPRQPAAGPSRQAIAGPSLSAQNVQHDRSEDHMDIDVPTPALPASQDDNTSNAVSRLSLEADADVSVHACIGGRLLSSVVSPSALTASAPSNFSFIPPTVLASSSSSQPRRMGQFGTLNAVVEDDEGAASDSSSVNHALLTGPAPLPIL